MAREFEVKTRLTASDEASATVAKVQGSFDSLGTAVSESAVSMVSATAVVAAFVSAMKFSIAASNEQEDALVRLSTALNLRGVGAFSDALIAQANALQKVTTFSDDAIERAQALLATYGVTGEKLAIATEAAVNLSAALGTDLGSAAGQVGAAFNGVTRGLEKLVPDLKSASDAGFSGAKNMDLLKASLDGVAESVAKTTSGQWEQFKNQVNELGEKLGDAGKHTEAFTAASVELAAIVGLLNRIMDIGKRPVIDYGDAFAHLVEEQEAAIRTVTRLADIQDRSTRILSENATQTSRAAQLAAELGLTLTSQTAQGAALTAEKMAELNELLRINGDTIAQNTDKLRENTQATQDNVIARDRLGRVTSITSPDGRFVTIVDQGSALPPSVAGGNFGGGSYVNAFSPLAAKRAAGLIE